LGQIYDYFLKLPNFSDVYCIIMFHHHQPKNTNNYLDFQEFIEKVTKTAVFGIHPNNA